MGEFVSFHNYSLDSYFVSFFCSQPLLVNRLQWLVEKVSPIHGIAVLQTLPVLIKTMRVQKQGTTRKLRRRTAPGAARKPRPLTASGARRRLAGPSQRRRAYRGDQDQETRGGHVGALHPPRGRSLGGPSVRRRRLTPTCRRTSPRDARGLAGMQSPLVPGCSPRRVPHAPRRLGFSRKAARKVSVCRRKATRRTRC